MSLSTMIRRLRRPAVAAALISTGLLAAGGAVAPAQAQYYPYYGYNPYYTPYCNPYYYPYGCPYAYPSYSYAYPAAVAFSSPVAVFSFNNFNRGRFFDRDDFFNRGFHRDSDGDFRRNFGGGFHHGFVGAGFHGGGGFHGGMGGGFHGGMGGGGGFHGGMGGGGGFHHR